MYLQGSSHCRRIHNTSFIITAYSEWKIPLMTVGTVQDNFGRLHERSKEISKTLKQLVRLFPNKVTIQLPQVNDQILFAELFC